MTGTGSGLMARNSLPRGGVVCPWPGVWDHRIGPIGQFQTPVRPVVVSRGRRGRRVPGRQGGRSGRRLCCPSSGSYTCSTTCRSTRGRCDLVGRRGVNGLVGAPW